ncbi:hypothetical protein D3C75_1129180 [compost metagenome]
MYSAEQPDPSLLDTDVPASDVLLSLHHAAELPEPWIGVAQLSDSNDDRKTDGAYGFDSNAHSSAESPSRCCFCYSQQKECYGTPHPVETCVHHPVRSGIAAALQDFVQGPTSALLEIVHKLDG